MELTAQEVEILWSLAVAKKLFTIMEIREHLSLTRDLKELVPLLFMMEQKGLVEDNGGYWELSDQGWARLKEIQHG